MLAHYDDPKQLSNMSIHTAPSFGKCAFHTALGYPPFVQHNQALPSGNKAFKYRYCGSLDGHRDRSGSEMVASAVLTPPLETAARPDAQGRFGKFGGKYVPETLIAALTELEGEFHRAMKDKTFKVIPQSVEGVT